MYFKQLREREEREREREEGEEEKNLPKGRNPGGRIISLSIMRGNQF